MFRGHRAALVWLAIAGVAGLLAFGLLLWATVRPSWSPADPPAIETAAAWVEWFGVVATVIAIVAAYVELRTLFPPQQLHVELHTGPTQDWTDASWLIFKNEGGSALINAYRLEIWVEDENGHEEGYHGHDPTHVSMTEPGWERARYIEEYSNYFPLRWTYSSDRPFFPGTEVRGCYVVGEDYQRTWRATWHTDRSSSSQPLSFDIPVTPTD